MDPWFSKYDFLASNSSMARELLEMLILELHPQPPESETPGLGSSLSVSTSLLGYSEARSDLRTL